MLWGPGGMPFGTVLKNNFKTVHHEVYIYSLAYIVGKEITS